MIDIFSKYGWLIPLKNKTGKAVANALKDIFAERRPTKMWVDKGKEFYNKDVQELVELYSTENEENHVWLKDDGIGRRRKRCGNILQRILQGCISMFSINWFSSITLLNMLLLR